MSVKKTPAQTMDSAWISLMDIAASALSTTLEKTVAKVISWICLKWTFILGATFKQNIAHSNLLFGGGINTSNDSIALIHYCTNSLL